MMLNDRDNLCIYLDLENISKTKNINISKIMKDIITKYDTKEKNNEPVFVYKIACGNTESISKYREQLKNLNFEIKEAPHIAKKKNRSDLIISLDAFEKLYLDKPTINEFIFVTNDSDFSVIMDILRRYGKKLVLITSKDDSDREIFNNSSDDILIIDNYCDNPDEDGKSKTSVEKKEVKKSGAAKHESTAINEDDTAVNKLLKILKALDQDKHYTLANVASKFKVNNKSFDISKTKFKKFGKLAEYMQEKGIIKIENINNDKIITIINLELAAK